MDWNAVGAVATIAAAIVAYFQLRKKPQLPPASPPTGQEPAIVSFRIDTIEGSIPPKLYENLRKDEFDFNLDQLAAALNRIGASRIEIVSQSDSTVQDVRLRLSIVGDVYSLGVSYTKHLAKEAVKIEPDKHSIRICIEEMAKGEIIVLAAFHEGFGSVRLKPERANIELVDADLYRICYPRAR